MKETLKKKSFSIASSESRHVYHSSFPYFDQRSEIVTKLGGEAETDLIKIMQWDLI
jgi:hypothetical protein